MSAWTFIRKSWSISIFTDQFEHKTFSQPPEVGVLVNYLKRNFPGAAYKSVYEAGYSGFWIHDRLARAGHPVPLWSIRPMCPPRTKSAQARPTG